MEHEQMFIPLGDGSQNSRYSDTHLGWMSFDEFIAACDKRREARPMLDTDEDETWEDE